MDISLMHMLATGALAAQKPVPPSPLPSEYRMVECLVADASPWIDPGFVHGVDDIYEIKVAAPVSASAGVRESKSPIGGGYSNTDSNFGVWIGRYPGKGVNVTFGVGNAEYETGYVSMDVSVPHTYRTVLATAQLLVDGTLVGQAATPGTYPNPRKLTLFGSWRHKSSYTHPSSVFSGSVYFFKAWRAGDLLRDMIPVVRIADSKPGMYDLCGSICSLTDTPFYINSGTDADFTWVELS